MTKPREYFCNVIYCTSPLEGIYRFEDIFHLYPIPDEFDLKNDRIDHFPILLEYWISPAEKQQITDKLFDGVEDFMSTSTAQNNKLHLILRLLSTFTNYRFFSYGPELAWFVPVDKKEILANIEGHSSSWGLKFYNIKGLAKKLRISDFTNTVGPEVEKEHFVQHFTRPHFDERKVSITFPNEIDLFLNAYFKLTQEEKKPLDASLTLIYNGQELRTKMKSLAFVSFISSIETLASFEFRDKVQDIVFECNSCKTIKTSPYNCPSCSNPIWGISQQFKEFLRRYLSADPKYNAIFNKFYGIRSKIAHSGQLLLGDSYIDWGSDQKQSEEWKTLITLMQYTKISTCRWLLENLIQKEGI